MKTFCSTEAPEAVLAGGGNAKELGGWTLDESASNKVETSVCFGEFFCTVSVGDIFEASIVIVAISVELKSSIFRGSGKIQVKDSIERV